MTRRPAAVLTAALALTSAGCGISDPYRPAIPSTPPTPSTTSTTASTPTPAADSGDPAPERHGTIPSRLQARQNTLGAYAGAPTPRAALERYAHLYLNWTASRLAARQRQLAAISTGQARAQALQVAASAARDPELTARHVANHGQLLAIAHGAGAAAGRWVLVCQEITTGTGDYTALPAALHITYAQVTHTPRGWVITQWSPQT